MNNVYWHSYYAKLAAIFLLALMTITLITPAYGKQCFTNVQQAYAYLLQQEASEKLVQQNRTLTIKVNINTASEAELTTLKGIGVKKAQAIILYREGFGRFESVDELTKVKGIGEKTVAKNRDRLTVR